MKKNEHHKNNSQKLALTLSLSLHTLLLLGAYCLPINPSSNPSSGYSVVLNPTWVHSKKASSNLSENPLPSSPLASEQADDDNRKLTEIREARVGQGTASEYIVPELQDTSRQDTPIELVERLVQEASAVAISSSPRDEATMTIDERSLYKVHQDKQIGPLLELAGWIWDMVPQPEDPTEESGKIVFQIKIDELGEVIAIKTLEKTISPLVEGIYKESLIGLTFSKTTDNLVHTPISTGKVTFILEVK